MPCGIVEAATLAQYGPPPLAQSLSRRAVPLTPVDRSRCNCRLLPWSVLPSPYSGRVGVHNFPFEACSGFTHVTARRVAQPPKAAFVAGLRYGQLPNRTACQLPGQTDHCPGGTCTHKVSAPFRAHRSARSSCLPTLARARSKQPKSYLPSCASCLRGEKRGTASKHLPHPRVRSRNGTIGG